VPETVACNLCGADDARPLFRLRDYRLRVDDIDWNAVRCRRCGLGYLNPRPAPDEIGRYYPERYFSHRGEQMERYVRQAAYVPKSGRDLLDIGTARGDFLAVMRDRGWNVAGIEPDPKAGNPHAVTIHRTPFPDGCELPDASYDVVTAWAVLEHLYDPGAAFATFARLVRPGGTLIIQVPNLRSIYSRWALLEDVPRHLYFFSESTLRAYAHQAGLELEQVTHTTDLFGGSGRGVGRLFLLRALGKSVPEFFEMWRTSRAQRFKRWPLLAMAWTAVSAIERVVLPDWMIRRLRISGQIVAEIRKPLDTGSGDQQPGEDPIIPVAPGS
jgi:2-polyprenyl-3-methyl-5-hydroxy-6-metoxy-1,4-benzoquinol methylase